MRQAAQTCDECYLPFSGDEWDDRHTSPANPLAQVHVGCCSECNEVDTCVSASEQTIYRCCGCQEWDDYGGPIPHWVDADNIICDDCYDELVQFNTWWRHA